MRNSLLFIGGILVGFGLATFVFAIWVWTMLHHMFIMGISNWATLFVIVALPILSILLGIALALAGRNRRKVL